MPFGTDISTFPDLDPAFTVISGPRVVIEALARRLTTPRGSLVSDPDYGFDLRQLLHLDTTPQDEGRLLAQMQAQIEADERVLGASVRFVRSAGDTLRVVVRFRTLDGPFAFTLAVADAGAAILPGET